MAKPNNRVVAPSLDEKKYSLRDDIISKAITLLAKAAEQNKEELDKKDGIQRVFYAKKLAEKAFKEAEDFYSSKTKLKITIEMRQDALKEFLKQAVQNYGKPAQEKQASHEQSFSETLENTRRYAIEKAALDKSIEVLCTVFGASLACDIISGYIEAVYSMKAVSKQSIENQGVMAAYTPLFDFVIQGAMLGAQKAKERHDHLLRSISGHHNNGSGLDDGMAANALAAQQAAANSQANAGQAALAARPPARPVVA